MPTIIAGRLPQNATQRRGEEIDPDIARFNAENFAAGKARAADIAPGRPPTLDERRAIALQVRKVWAEGGPVMARTFEFDLGDDGARGRVYVPENAHPGAAFLYMHGGGWMIYSIDSHDRLMREYAESAKCTVIGLDYRLAPERKFPAALDDIDALYGWLKNNTDGVPSDKLAIGGDSAGGNLALCSSLRRRDRGENIADALLLNYAAIDIETSRESYSRYSGMPYMLDTDEMMDFWRGYLPAFPTDDPYARPLLANLSDLPPVYMNIAGCDVLRDENLALYEQLKEAGVDVTANLYEGATHSFLEAMSISELARRAIRDGANWIAAQIGRA